MVVSRISRECTVEAIGKTWTFSRFTRKVWIDFAKWGQSLLPDPCRKVLDICEELAEKDNRIIRQIKTEDMAERDAAKAANRKPVLLAPTFVGFSDVAWEKALAISNRYLHAGSPELIQLIGSSEGESYVLHLLLLKHHPDISEEDSWDVYNDLQLNDGADGRPTVKEILDLCSGRAPESVKNESSPGA